MKYNMSDTHSVNVNSLNTTCIKDWLVFFRKESIPFKIRPVQNVFQGDIQALHYNDGYTFLSLKSTPFKIISKQESYKDFFLIIASRGYTSWENGENSAVLPEGGITILNLNQPTTLNIENQNKVNILIIPFSLLSLYETLLINMSITQKSMFQDCIARVMFSMNVTDADLLLKINAVKNLLMIMSNEETFNEKLEEDFIFNKISEFIDKHVFDPKLNMSYLSSELGMSKSKIQKVLFKHKLSYRYMVINSRVEILANKIRSNENKKVSVLCYESGFKTVSNAAAQFKKIKKMSITDYKKTVSNIGIGHCIAKY